MGDQGCRTAAELIGPERPNGGVSPISHVPDVISHAPLTPPAGFSHAIVHVSDPVSSSVSLPEPRVRAASSSCSAIRAS